MSRPLTYFFFLLLAGSLYSCEGNEKMEEFLTFHWERPSGNLVGWVQVKPDWNGLLVNSFAVYRDEE